MICRLCLKDITEVINIFDERGVELNVAAVLAKYFWFEPRSDDPISTAICNSCWISVSSFNEFYLIVEEAHRLLTERFSLKSEVQPKCRKRRCYSITDAPAANEWLHASLPSTTSKKEFGIEQETIDDSSRDKQTPDEKSCEDLKLLKSEISSHEDESSMIIESFIDEMLELEEDEADALALPDESKLHSTRSNTKKDNKLDKCSSDTDAKNDVDEVKPNVNNSVGNKKRRGRPPTIKKQNADDETPKKEKSKTKRITNKADDSQQESYEERMRQIDEKIAQCIRLTCEKCGDEQTTFCHLRKHMEKVHQCKGYITCCNKKFSKRSLLVGHIEKHINPDCYKCEVCDKSFADKQCMRNHFLIKHQPEEEKQYKCEHCPKRFARPYILEQHRIIHEERKHICNVCQKGFATGNLLNTHMKTMHSTYGATMCDVCAKVIRGRTAFARHQLEHSGVVLPKVQCDKCGSWHKDKYSLQKHKRRHNDDGTIYVCKMCGKKAPNRSALLSHQRYVHTSARDFECNVCSKAFKKAITLKEHMAMHTGEVLYNCPYCPKTFNSNANMHSHRKKIHPKEFEEARKQRRENASKPDVPDERKKKTVGTALEQSKPNEYTHNCSDDDSTPQVILIKSDDGRETNILVTTGEDFSDNDGEVNLDGDSIVFTIN
ncbi:transcription factor grauzone-like isoform X1 [Rhagoletis pomonella]|uniref:transcription factor grauzone-like isoform X1 n=1 Tax=Rhagoletis pomonella TaxID=28610 RepID=UPI00177B34CB|nr:transcription factor grauzone-like isoform X1 [Rhagoletis pomonella]